MLRFYCKIFKVADPNSRVHCNAICWHPDVATQLVTASGDDRSPVVQVCVSVCQDYSFSVFMLQTVLHSQSYMYLHIHTHSISFYLVHTYTYTHTLVHTYTYTHTLFLHIYTHTSLFHTHTHTHTHTCHQKLWDLRFATSPMRTLERHKKGILSLSWCPQDPDLLLSASKDNLVLCWNPNSDIAGGEVCVCLLVSV